MSRLQLAEPLADRLLVENTDDGVLAVDARHDRDAEVDPASFDLQPETSVLRDSLLRDVELRHDFDTADDLGVVRLRDRLHRPSQSPVDAVLDDHFVIPGLDMDIRCTPVQRVVDGGVDESNDRARRIRETVDGERFFAVLVLPDDLHVEAFGSLFQDALGALTLLQELLNRGVRPDRRSDRHLQNRGQLVQHRDVRGIGGHDHQFSVLFLVREEVVAKHQIDGDAPEELLIGLKALEVDESQTAALRESLGVVHFLVAGFLRRQWCAFRVELRYVVISIEVCRHPVLLHA